LATTLLILALIRSPVSKKYLLFSALLTLLNPAVHFHVLFFIVTASIIFVYMFLYWGIGARKLLSSLLWLGGYIVLAVVPYILFVYLVVLKGSSGISESIPVNYFTISSGSSSFLQIFALQTPAPVDSFLANFMSIGLSAWSIIYFLIALLPLVFLGQIRRTILSNKKRARWFAVLSLYIIAILSIWLSLGYISPVSFQSLTAKIAPELASEGSFIGSLLIEAVNLMVQVLRFPHRFQFLIMYSVAILMALSLPVLFILLKNKFRNYFVRISPLKYLASAVIFILLFVPLAANQGYREVLTSGNFSDNLEPYTVPRDLKDIKSILDRDGDEYKILVLPSVSMTVNVEDEAGVQHIFHDKLYIYYLNKPSIDYALSGSVAEKSNMFLLYRAFHYGESWWLNILRNSNIKYIVLNKEIVSRTYGGERLPGIGEKIGTTLKESPEMETVWAGDRFELFRVKNFDNTPKDDLFLDVNWITFLSIMKQNPDLFLKYKVHYSFDYTGSCMPVSDNWTIMYDDESRAELDLGILEGQRLFTPDRRLIPFINDVTPSSRYTDNMFSLFTLLGTGKYNYYGMVVPGLFGSLGGNFIGTSTQATIRIPFEVATRGYYTLYLRGSYNAADVRVSFTGQPGEKELVLTSEEKYGVFNYEYKEIWSGELNEGSYSMSIEKLGGNLIIDGLVAQHGDLPALDAYGLNLIPVK